MAQADFETNGNCVVDLDTALREHLPGCEEWFLQFQDEVRFDAHNPDVPTRHQEYIATLPERHAKVVAELSQSVGNIALRAS